MYFFSKYPFFRYRIQIAKVDGWRGEGAFYF